MVSAIETAKHDLFSSMISIDTYTGSKTNCTMCGEAFKEGQLLEVQYEGDTEGEVRHIANSRGKDCYRWDRMVVSGTTVRQIKNVVFQGEPFTMQFGEFEHLKDRMVYKSKPFYVRAIIRTNHASDRFFELLDSR